MRVLPLISVSVLLLSSAFQESCAPASEPLVPDVGHGWLMFDIQTAEQSTTPGTRRFLAKYEAEGKIARFDIEVPLDESSEFPPSAKSNLGKFLAIKGSDASVLLRNLKETLEATKLPSRVDRVLELPFAAVVLGTHMSHSRDGGFFAKPAGNWTPVKLFIGKSDDPAEVFLNINPVLHKGEFSIKDPDYGDDVLRELARVL